MVTDDGGKIMVNPPVNYASYANPFVLLFSVLSLLLSLELFSISSKPLSSGGALQFMCILLKALLGDMTGCKGVYLTWQRLMLNVLLVKRHLVKQIRCYDSFSSQFPVCVLRQQDLWD